MRPVSVWPIASVVFGPIKGYAAGVDGQPLQKVFVPAFNNSLRRRRLGIALTGLMPLTVKGLELAGLPVADPPPGLPIDLPELPLAFLSVVILIPLFEELLFRGLLLNWLKQRMVWWLAALTSSVLFALLHNNGFHNGLSGWLLFGNRVLMALLASFFAVRYRTLRASFVMHATANSIGVMGTVFLGDSGLAAWV
jgi:membrane protease YdiL (CAAX protease family)